MQFSQKYFNLAAVVGILLAIIALGHSIGTKQETIKTINVQKIIADFSGQLAHSHLNKAQKGELVTHFSQELGSTLRDYAAKNHTVILTERAVLAGKTDITEQVEALISNKLKKNTKKS